MENADAKPQRRQARREPGDGIQLAQVSTPRRVCGKRIAVKRRRLVFLVLLLAGVSLVYWWWEGRLEQSQDIPIRAAAKRYRVEPAHAVAGVDQVRRHRATHVAQSQERNLGHRGALSRRWLKKL